jgi:hypothetical protein
VSTGFGAVAFGIAVLGAATSADNGGIVNVRFPCTEPSPKTTLHVAFGIVVGTVTVAGVEPLLKAVTSS